MGSGRSYALLGASGLVGGHLQSLLANDPGAYERGVILSRRRLEIASPPGAQALREVVVDFDRPESFRGDLAVDDVFCALGTTIKKAGSQAAFHRVDCDIPLAAAREARAAGATRFFIVTAVGADAKSGIFYNRVKGEVEEGLAAIGFPRGLHVFRPSLIVGERAERRPAERMAMAVMTATRPLFMGALARYRAIDAGDVARAMVRVASDADPSPGVHVYEGRRLFDRAQ
jgi:uncharacterized protein YbjT (DUF2867 family)